jgi:hypothetical protein
LDGGADVRYMDQYHGVYFAVSDKKTCASVVSGEPRRVSLSEPITMLWAEDQTYGKYLASTFEIVWAHAVPAAERIMELKQNPLTLSG